MQIKDIFSQSWQHWCKYSTEMCKNLGQISRQTSLRKLCITFVLFPSTKSLLFPVEAQNENLLVCTFFRKLATLYYNVEYQEINFPMCHMQIVNLHNAQYFKVKDENFRKIVCNNKSPMICVLFSMLFCKNSVKSIPCTEFYHIS